MMSMFSIPFLGLCFFSSLVWPRLGLRIRSKILDGIRMMSFISFSTHPSRLYSLSTANFRFAEFGELLKSWRRTYNAEGLRGAALEWVTGSYWRRAINLNVAGSAFFRAFSSFPHHSSQQVGLICASPVRKSPKPEATRGIFEIIDSEGVKCICIFLGAFPKRVQLIHR